MSAYEISKTQKTNLRDERGTARRCGNVMNLVVSSLVFSNFS